MMTDQELMTAANGNHDQDLVNLGPGALLVAPAVKGAAGAVGAKLAHKGMNKIGQMRRGKLELQNLDPEIDLQELIGLAGVKKAAIGAAKKKIGFQNLQMLI